MTLRPRLVLTRRDRWLLFCAALALLACWAWHARRPAEPLFRERPLGYWMEQMTDPARAENASEMLNRAGPDDIPALLTALETQDSTLGPWPRRLAVRLGLAAPLVHDAAAIRATAAFLLGQLGPDAVTASHALAGALADPDPDVRRKAARALGRMGRLAVPALLASLDSHDNTARFGAAKALGYMGPAASRASAPLSERLFDHHEPVRQAAFETLGEIGPGASPALPVLAKLLEDPAPARRLMAVRTIGKIGPAARPLLPKLLELNDREPELHEAIRQAVARVSP